MRPSSPVGFGPLNPVPSRASRTNDAPNALTLTLDRARESARVATAELVAAIRPLTVTNAAVGASNTSAAIGKLNAALAVLNLLRASAPEAARHIEAAIRDALNLLRTAGVDGVTLDSSARGARFNVNEAELTASLAAKASTLPDAPTPDARASIVTKALSAFSALRAANQPGYSRESAERAYGSPEPTSNRTPAPSSPRQSPSR